MAVSGQGRLGLRLRYPRKGQGASNTNQACQAGVWKIGNLLCPDPGDLKWRHPQSAFDIPGPNGCRKALASAAAKPLLMKCIPSPRRSTHIFGDGHGSELVS